MGNYKKVLFKYMKMRKLIIFFALMASVFNLLMAQSAMSDWLILINRFYNA